jgi:hypothetical protein
MVARTLEGSGAGSALLTQLVESVGSSTSARKAGDVGRGSSLAIDTAAQVTVVTSAWQVDPDSISETPTGFL